MMNSTNWARVCQAHADNHYCRHPNYLRSTKRKAVVTRMRLARRMNLRKELQNQRMIPRRKRKSRQMKRRNRSPRPTTKDSLVPNLARNLQQRKPKMMISQRQAKQRRRRRSLHKALEEAPESVQSAMLRQHRVKGMKPPHPKNRRPRRSETNYIS